MYFRIGKVSKLIFPGYGFCKKCNTTWNLVRIKDVAYSEDGGCFHLCEKCWKESSQEERIEYYLSTERYRRSKTEIETLIKNIVSH